MLLRRRLLRRGSHQRSNTLHVACHAINAAIASEHVVKVRNCCAIKLTGRAKAAHLDRRQWCLPWGRGPLPSSTRPWRDRGGHLLASWVLAGRVRPVVGSQAKSVSGRCFRARSESVVLGGVVSWSRGSPWFFERRFGRWVQASLIACSRSHARLAWGPGDPVGARNRIENFSPMGYQGCLKWRLNP